MGIEQTMFSGRFGQYVRDRHEPCVAPPAPETPTPLPQETRETIAHHLIPLALLARTDGSVAEAEQKAMLDHAVAVLAAAGHPVGEADLAKLKAYIMGFRPTLMQLDPALHRLEQETTDNKIAFLGAARAVVMADGRLDTAEARLLDELKLEFAKA
jgi:hypothetical protein